MVATLKQSWRGSSEPWGAMRTAVQNIMDVLNALVPSANLSLEKGAGVPVVPSSAVAAGSALTLTAASHSGRLIQLDTATGSTVTLPASSGSGAVFECVVTVLATSNSHIIKVANGTDVMVGYVLNQDTDTANAFTGFNTTSTSDTITLNRSTTGSVSIGERIRLRDVKTGFWTVEGYTTSTGAPATPFSATV